MKDFIFVKKLGVFRNEAGEKVRETVAERTIKIVTTTLEEVEESDIFTPLFELDKEDPEIATVHPVEIIYGEEALIVSDHTHEKSYPKEGCEIVREYFYPEGIKPTGCFPCRRCGKCNRV